jgi:ribosomal protein L19
VYKGVLKSIFAGSVVRITYMYHEKLLSFVGICVSRHMKSRELVLRIFIVNTPIDYIFYVDCPNVLNLKVLYSPRLRHTKAKATFIKGKLDLRFLSFY